jgi:site-specific DNA-cytosine methylase
MTPGTAAETPGDIAIGLAAALEGFDQMEGDDTVLVEHDDLTNFAKGEPSGTAVIEGDASDHISAFEIDGDQESHDCELPQGRRQETDDWEQPRRKRQEPDDWDHPHGQQNRSECEREPPNKSPPELQPTLKPQTGPQWEWMEEPEPQSEGEQKPQNKTEGDIFAISPPFEHVHGSEHGGAQAGCGAAATSAAADDGQDIPTTLKTTFPLRFATDFSGMDMFSLVMSQWRDAIELQHSFASDKWGIARNFIAANHLIAPECIYDDVLTRPDPAQQLVAYAAGPPCQSFSSAGRRRGLADPRGQLFHAALRTIERCQPFVFILENVARLVSFANGAFFRQTIAELSAMGYGVQWAVLNSTDFGLPQYRLRVYIAGVRLDRLHKPWVIPSLLPDDLHLTLEQLLAPRSAADDPERRPRAPGARRNVDLAAARALSRGLEEWTVSAGVSVQFGGRSGPAPRTVLPCLLKSASSGDWIGSRGRPITFNEAARFQGICADQYRWPAATGHRFGLIGNSMTMPVVSRLTHVLLDAISWPGLPADPWTTGAAQLRLTADAQGHPARTATGVGLPAPGVLAAARRHVPAETEGTTQRSLLDFWSRRLPANPDRAPK